MIGFGREILCFRNEYGLFKILTNKTYNRVPRKKKKIKCGFLKISIQETKKSIYAKLIRL